MIMSRRGEIKPTPEAIQDAKNKEVWAKTLKRKLRGDKRRGKVVQPSSSSAQPQEQAFFNGISNEIDEHEVGDCHIYETETLKPANANDKRPKRVRFNSSNICVPCLHVPNNHGTFQCDHEHREEGTVDQVALEEAMNDVRLENYDNVETDNYWIEYGNLEENERLLFGDQLSSVLEQPMIDEDSDSFIGTKELQDEESAYDNFVGLDKNKNLQYFMKSYENSLLLSSATRPRDAGKPFSKDSQLPTIGDVCMSLASVQAKNGITNTAMTDILSVLQKAAPELLSLPVKQTKNGNFSLTLHQYLGQDFRKYKVNVCPDGCTAYIGKHEHSLKCANPNCSYWRFEPCSHAGHKIRGRDREVEKRERQECNPFYGGHSITQRTPTRSFYYRGVIPLLKSLIHWEMKSGLNLYNYQAERLRQPTSDGEDRMYDILDGSHAKNNLRQMRDRFMRYQAKINASNDLIEISLLLSEFYDGALLHKRNSTSLWPLVISILNCNPSNRMKHGIGQFLVALHNLKLGSEAEQAIFYQLFIPELQQLGKGIHFNVVVNGARREIFLQARLIVHVLDTKALEHVACISGTNSRIGCALCNSMKGISRKKRSFAISKIINIGARGITPADYILRHYGASKTCCPTGYYDGDDDSIKAVEDLVKKYNSDRASKAEDDEESVAASVTTNNSAMEQAKKDIDPFRQKIRKLSCDNFGYESTLHSTRYSKMLFNSKFSVNDFKAYLCFAHCDFRKPIVYGRHGDEAYLGERDLENSLDENLQANEYWTEIPDIDQYTEERAELTRERLAEIGVHSVWVYSSLPSARIQRALIYDPFHAMANLVKDLIAILKGDRATEFPTLRLSAAEGRFPGIKVPKAGVLKSSTTTKNGEVQFVTEVTEANVGDKRKRGSNKKKGPSANAVNNSKYKRNIPWLMTVADQYVADSFQNCILTPVGLSDKFNIKNPIKLPAYMKGHQKIKYLTTFINFGLHFTTLTKEYKNLVAIISSVICDLNATVLDPDTPEMLDLSTPIPVSDVKKIFYTHYSLSPVALFYRTCEMLCLFEGMLPDSECQFSHHELLDIAYQLRVHGPVRNWWALPGERFMRSVTKLVPDGGSNPLLTISSYHAAEETCQSQRYIADDKNLDNKGRYRDNRIKLENNSELPLHPDNWSNWLRTKLYTAIYFNFIRVLPDDGTAQQKSPFCRLYLAFLAFRKGKHNNLEFCDWLAGLQNNNEYNISILSADIQLASLSTSEISRYLDTPAVFIQDMAVITDILELKPEKVCCRAWIKGLIFTARGQYHSETSNENRYKERWGQQNEDIWPANRLNDLINQWDDHVQYSSWFKLNNILFPFLYGQFNYFFRLNLPCDPLLHQLPIANCIVRKIETEKGVKVYLPKITLRTRNKENGTSTIISNNYQFYSQFVFLNFVESTRVGVCGVTTIAANGILPILIPSMKQDCMTKENMYSENPRDIDVLYLIDLEPNRRNVTISLDDSKLCELQ